MNSTMRRFLPYVLAAVTALVLIYVYNRVSWTIPTNSDNASPVLEAYAFVHGNYLLHGWTAPPDNFYTTDYLFYEIIGLIFGFNVALMHSAPAVLYSFLVISTILVASADRRGRDRVASALLVAAVVAFPTGIMAQMLLLGPIHVGTLLFVVGALWASQAYKGSRRREHLVIMTALLALAVAGDPYALFSGVLPLLIVFVIEYSRDRDNTTAILVACAVGSVALAEVMVHVFHAFGGMTFAPLNAAFATVQVLPSNLWLAIQSVLGLFGINFFGATPLSEQALGGLWRLLELVLVVSGISLGIRKLRMKQDDMITRFSWIAISTVSLAFIFSNQPVDLSTARYLTPWVVFGSILVGRLYGPKFASMRYGFRGVGVYLLILATTYVPTLVVPVPPAPQVVLGKWLQAHGLRTGYAGYWDANIVTLVTSGRVRISPVVDNGTHIVPFMWNSNSGWYRKFANFAVFDTSNWGNVNLSTLTQQFGQPLKVETVGQYSVAIWDRNITGCLQRSDSCRQSVGQQFSVFYAAIHEYYAHYPDASTQIWPLQLERAGVLSSLFGGFPRSSKSWNWTSTGDWIGPWSSSTVGIGMSSLSPSQVHGVASDYHGRLSDIYYPFPAKWSATSRPADGQRAFALFVFPKP